MGNAMPGGHTAALAIPMVLSTLWAMVYLGLVGNRNSLFLLLGLLLVTANATSSFTSWCEPAFAAPTKHAGRHGRYYVTRGRGWRCFELHLALYTVVTWSLFD